MCIRRNGSGLYDGGGGGVGRDVVDRDNERRLRAMGIRLDKSRSPAAAAASSNPVKKHVYEASSRRKVVDTEDVHNISRRDGRTGKVTSETVRTNKHEVSLIQAFFNGFGADLSSGRLPLC